MQQKQNNTSLWGRIKQRRESYWEWDISKRSRNETAAYWDSEDAWSQGGEEWSMCWGSSHMQWYGSFLPRIHSFIPAHTILEIGPGFGRWTDFLRNYCSNLIAVDYSEKCIQACKERFADCSNMSFFVNDGKSLDMVPDNTIDFIFSFESLSYADGEKMSEYISQIARKLKRNGVAFIHHSNLDEYKDYFKMLKRISRVPKLLGVLTMLGIIEKHLLHGKARTMSAKKVQLYAEENELQCISQEFYKGDTKRYFFDCISTIAKRDSIWARDNKVFRNPSWEEEAQHLSKLSELYDFRSTK